ncbi:hypothetical protein A2U01_0107708, partial [Trifolium medium]|nr:hypothetical protein [Trifolium medium]
MIFRCSVANPGGAYAHPQACVAPPLAESSSRPIDEATARQLDLYHL